MCLNHVIPVINCYELYQMEQRVNHSKFSPSALGCSYGKAYILSIQMIFP